MTGYPVTGGDVPEAAWGPRRSWRAPWLGGPQSAPGGVVLAPAPERAPRLGVSLPRLTMSMCWSPWRASSATRGGRRLEVERVLFDALEHLGPRAGLRDPVGHQQVHRVVDVAGVKGRSHRRHRSPTRRTARRSSRARGRLPPPFVSQSTYPRHVSSPSRSRPPPRRSWPASARRGRPGGSPPHLAAREVLAMTSPVAVDVEAADPVLVGGGRRACCRDVVAAVGPRSGVAAVTPTAPGRPSGWGGHDERAADVTLPSGDGGVPPRSATATTTAATPSPCGAARRRTPGRPPATTCSERRTRWLVTEERSELGAEVGRGLHAFPTVGRLDRLPQRAQLTTVIVGIRPRWFRYGSGVGRLDPCRYARNTSTASLGIGEREPRLSWVLPAESGEQLAYEVEVDGTPVRVEGDAHVLVPWPGKALARASGARYASASRPTQAGASGPSRWSSRPGCSTRTTGRRPGCPPVTGPVRPVTGRRTGCAARSRSTEPVVRARLYATAHGIYEASTRRAARRRPTSSTPGYTEYAPRTQVQTYDVTALLAPGSHVVEALLADGWYRGQVGMLNAHDQWGTETAFLAQLHLEHEDGTTTVVGTDETWRWATLAHHRADLIEGQHEDRRLLAERARLVAGRGERSRVRRPRQLARAAGAAGRGAASGVGHVGAGTACTSSTSARTSTAGSG